MVTSRAAKVGERAVVLGGSIGGLLAARVLADSHEAVTVIDLASTPDHGHVTGVRVATRSHGFEGAHDSGSLLPADLVVDATGRRSRTPRFHAVRPNRWRRYDKMPRTPRGCS